eukprot:TsM_001040300 transcript=TsM_001040300 gene=TsM_001040300
MSPISLGAIKGSLSESNFSRYSGACEGSSTESLLPNLETAILQLGARECIVPSGLLSPDANASKLGSDKPGRLQYLQLVLERSNVLTTELDRSEYFTSDCLEEINMLLKQNKSELAESLLCLGAIFKFLRLQSNETLAHTFTISSFSLENHVRLDSAALNALHLLPTSSGSGGRYDSVYGVLNHCRTLQGQRLLAQWLRQPLTDAARINERLDLVEAFVEDSILRNVFYETSLRRVPDLPRLARRLQMSKANLQLEEPLLRQQLSRRRQQWSGSGNAHGLFLNAGG